MGVSLASDSRRRLLGLGAAPDPLTGAVRAPSEATLRRIATRVDPAALEAAIAVWTTARGTDGTRIAVAVAVAVDGKTVTRASSARSAITALRSRCSAIRSRDRSTNSRALV